MTAKRRTLLEVSLTILGVLFAAMIFFAAVDVPWWAPVPVGLGLGYLGARTSPRQDRRRRAEGVRV